MEDKIELRVLGLSFSQLKTGAYALILEQVGGPYRIPVVIGTAEAQAIAIFIERIKPPRPMTYDLFEMFSHAFGIKHIETYIYKFEDGIFYAELTFSDGELTVKMDSRASDAIAISLRTHTPIYTNAEVLAETGFLWEESVTATPESTVVNTIKENPKKDNLSLEELEKELTRLIDNEEYEKAAEIKRIIIAKRGKI